MIPNLAACFNGEPVHIERMDGEWEGLDGVITALSGSWAVLAALSDGHNDGYVAVRTADVTSAESFCSNTFVVKAHRFEPAPTPRYFSANFGTLEGLVSEIIGTVALVGFQREMSDIDELIVGIPEFVTEQDIVITEVSPQAELGEKAASVLRTADITRIEFGGRYLLRLTDLVT